jgi:hypothetical protein
LVILGSKISGQENTQPLKVDTMAKDKEQMTNNDLRNTTKRQKNEEYEPHKTGCELR